jgi:oligopeptide/dipeptide ABC transporter ATP-binding protein
VADGAPLVEVEDLVRVYAHGHGAGRRVVRAVDGVSFAIRAGETFGLVGESGSGKSTVARLVLRLDRPTGGHVRFDGRDIHAMSGREVHGFRRLAQVVFQDPIGALNRRKTVEQIITAPMAVHGVKPAERRARVVELLDLVGLHPSHAARHPSSLSGGQCQRVGIARALALSPRLVVLDEPVSAVDVSVRAQILNLLRDLQAELGLTYLFISHDLAIVRYVASRLAVMYRGRIVELGSREHVFAAPAHHYTEALLEAVPDPGRPMMAIGTFVADDDEPVVAIGVGCRYRDRCPRGRDEPRCATDDPILHAESADHTVACHFPLMREAHGEPRIALGVR